MNRVCFSVNGVKHSVGGEEDSDTSLNDYLRVRLNLRGTKYMCQEGGCGACIVAVTAPDILTGEKKTFSVNSCLVSITSCQGWDITTIEGIGDRLKGYHPVQKTLAEFNGSQCGYCTPGWVMSMYSLLESNHFDLKRYDIENSFGSNLCRCTGYRPILDAFKSFATDNPPPEQENIGDIEELTTCKKSGKKCYKKCDRSAEEGWCIIDKDDVNEKPKIEIELKDHKKFFKVYEVKDVFEILDKEGYDSFMLVGGNTGKGAYPIFAYPRILIDISTIKELKTHQIDQNLVLGAGMTLTDTMNLFKEISQKEEYFSYLAKFVAHLDLVAHIPVRNIGTLAGNLMEKHQHNEFASDPFLLFETVGATLTLLDRHGRYSEVNLIQFLKVDMADKIMMNVKLPPLSQDNLLVTYKIMPRAQNAHAQVHSGFLYHMDKDHETVLDARVVYGGLSYTFVHATQTELYLVGKKLFAEKVLQQALKILEAEIIVQEFSAEPSPAFRKKLALGLFYKGLLHLCPPNVLNPRYLSGTENYRQTRPISHGEQVYDTNKAVWPVSEPMPKLEALIQCAGEAPFVNDIQTLRDEVFAAFVMTTVGTGEIVHIDPKPALSLPGVIAFFSAKDIPGINSFQSLKQGFVSSEEEVFCNGTVRFFNQPLGVIVADTDKLANRAAKLVKVTYKNADKRPVLTTREAKKDPNRTTFLFEIPPVSRGANVTKIIKGGNDIFGQYHFTMEPQSCVTYPSEYGLNVYSATQWIDSTQQSISEALNIEKNRINMTVARLGGGYGSKISRSVQVAVACSLVSKKLNRPCRFILTIEENMRVCGKRLPSSSNFEVGVDDMGAIQYLEYQIFDDNGYVVNEPLLLLGVPSLKNCYDRRNWHCTAYNVTTDTHSNSWFRAPGTLEAVAMTEYIMEQISYELSLDPIDVRMTNINQTETDTIEIIETLRRESDYDSRKTILKEFNQRNRWKKRGIRIVPMSWPIPITAYYDVVLNVYHGDGTVVITHGSIEMGQGINTKAAQVCAYILKIPLNKVKVEKSNVILSSNAMATGGSVSSEAVCFAVIKACQLLLSRLAPVRAQMVNPSWEDLIQTAYKQGILLLTAYNYTANDQILYRVAGAAIVEVELDLLTGEHIILRADVLEDVGQSLNPEIDVGQVEGAFVTGIGYWTSEHLLYDHKTGELLTNRTWDYFIPSAKDIPIDFRVKFRRNSFSPIGVLGSKAVGEPATCLALAVGLALREAIAASRSDSGRPETEWFNIPGPYTTENMIMAADVRLDEFRYQ